MMTPEDSNRLKREIMAQGYTDEEAEKLAGLLGDTRELDADGLWVVRDEQDNVVARLRPWGEEL